MKGKNFHQDFLMDFPYDKNEFPLIKIKYTFSIDNYFDIKYPYNIFDILYGKIRTISLTYLHQLSKVNEWNLIIDKIKKLDSLIIIDDLEIKNEISYKFKEFYIKVYIWNLKIYNKNIYVYSKNKF